MTHTPGPWGLVYYTQGVEPPLGWPHEATPTVFAEGSDRGDVAYLQTILWGSAVAKANARLIAAAPDLLALGKQYAGECGECAGTRVCPDDQPCEECKFIWDVIEKAEGRS